MLAGRRQLQRGGFILEDVLLPRVARGEETAVRECLSRYGDLIWSLARRLLPTSADAADAVQDIFVEIWKNAERFNEQVASEKTFVVMLARRRLIDRRRKLGRSPQVQLIDETTLDTPSQGQADVLELADEAEQANRCLDTLQKEQRRALELAVYHGLSHSQISDCENAPLGTVKAWVRRGMIQLRDCMNLSHTSKGGSK